MTMPLIICPRNLLPEKIAGRRRTVVQFNDWCRATDAPIGSHSLRVLYGDPTRLDVAIAETAAIVPSHYAAEEHISRVLARLGKPSAAKFISEKLPTTKSIRSGDLGEIFATEYIVGHTAYAVPIKRLRWKDHRNMAMRGDDVIGIPGSNDGSPPVSEDRS